MARAFVSRLLDQSGALSLFMALRSRARSSWLTVLTYHRVGDPATAHRLDDQVIDVRPDAFDRQVAFVKEYCTPISLDDLLAFRRGGSLPPNPVLITFDDGYRDNYDVALPILQKHGVPAVFFIATDYVEERRLFWWDRINYVLKHSEREVLELTYPRRRSLPRARPDDRARTIRALLSIAKAHFDLDLSRFLEHVEQAAGVSISREEERQMVEPLLMTWKEVRAMRAAGMAVQSHTRTHRTLHTLTERGLHDELHGSRMKLEEVLGEPVRAVAYPVGKGLDKAPAARAALRAAGYELGFSNGSGVNSLWRFDPLNVRRVSLEVDLGDANFRGMVAVPYLAYDNDVSVVS